MDLIQVITDQAVIWSITFISLCVLIAVMHVGGSD